MPLLHAIVLGVVQGLSEFLPISSSGHLILVPWLFGWEELADNPELNRSFDVALHVGTFLALIVYFCHDLAVLAAAGVRSLLRRRVEGQQERLAWLLVVATIPAATVGFVLDSLLAARTGGEAVIGVMLAAFGVVLLIADRAPARRKLETFRLGDAALMGIAQAVALQPGVSRSGVTISVGRWLGFDRDAAARISFLMMVPITGGLGLYKALDVFAFGEGLPPGFAAPFAWGTAAAAVTGFIAVWGLLRLVRSRAFTPFVIYRVLAGAGVVGLALARG